MATEGLLIIRCPRCNKVVTRQPETVVSYYDPEFKCKTRGCLYVGRLSGSIDDSPAVSPRVGVARRKSKVKTTRKGRSDKGVKRGKRKL